MLLKYGLPSQRYLKLTSKFVLPPYYATKRKFPLHFSLSEISKYHVRSLFVKKWILFSSIVKYFVIEKK